MMSTCKRLIVLVLATLLAPSTVQASDAEGATEIDYRHGYGFLTSPRYPATFTHFEYLNPDAPKGGRIRVPQMGNWDNFNPISTKGRLAAGMGFWSRDTNLLWATLLVPALDEPATHYGLVADGIAVAPDRSWVAFRLREGIHFHDGHPITVEDVEFTFNAVVTDSAPGIQSSFTPFTFEQLGPREFRFLVPPALRDDPEIPIRLGAIPVLPKHYWGERDITKTTVEPPLGSGPYRLGRFDIGRWLEFERVEDYWGRDLPVNRGKHNFDVVKYDYFRDDQVQTEAVKGNVVDVHVENVPSTWFESYNTPAHDDGILKKVEYKLARPAGLWWPVFWNMSQPRFQDIRVRKALWLLNDMDWANKRSYQFWGKATSFFHDSELAATGLPSARELALLEPLRDLVPPAVFTEAYEAQPNAGPGWSRDNILEAHKLLQEAGWVVRDRRLVHGETGEPFTLRFVAVSPALGRSFIAFTRRLEKLGISSTIKSPEISNWLFRMRSGDFDAGAIWFLPNFTPTLQIHNTWHSSQAGLDYSSNWSNLKDPAIDRLIEAIAVAQTWEDYVAAIRAFDRVMLHNYYWVPMMSKTRHALAYWDKFGQPEHDRLVRLAFTDTWWWDEDKARRVSEYAGRDK